jgi:hypothetical protein
MVAVYFIHRARRERRRRTMRESRSEKEHTAAKKWYQLVCPKYSAPELSAWIAVDSGDFVKDG